MANQLDTRRHLELFDADSFTDKVTIIGAGATGSWLALQLAKLGIKGDQITVWDFDKIEEHNVPNQAFDLEDVGMYKVDALKRNLQLASGTEVNTRNEKFEQARLSGYVFLMVDSMAERKRIWEESIKMKSAVKLLIEPRMGLDVGRVYNVNPTDVHQCEKYDETFSYTDEEAEVSACGTSMTVITTAMNISSICARQLINYNDRTVELDNEILIDLKHNNMFTTRWEG